VARSASGTSGAAQLAGVGQAHEQIADLRPVEGSIQQRTLAMQDCPLQAPFEKIIVQGRSGPLQKQRQRLPVHNTYVIAFPKLEFGSTLRSVNYASSQSCGLSITGAYAPGENVTAPPPSDWHHAPEPRLVVLCRTRRLRFGGGKDLPRRRCRRSLSIANKLASSGACPTNLTNVNRLILAVTSSAEHSGHVSPEWNVKCETATCSPPRNAAAGLRPWPDGDDSLAPGLPASGCILRQNGIGFLRAPLL